MNIKFYGTRGSAPLSGEEFTQYGGATTCIYLEMDGTNIMIDCGSGAQDAARDLANLDELHLLITHPHLDHISGAVSIIPAFGNKKLHIYGKERDGLKVEEQLERIMSDPLWPVKPGNFKNTVFHDLGDADFYINDLHIRTMESNHPGGCTLYSIEGKNEKVIAAFDFNHGAGFGEKLIEFAKDADVMFYDGCFTEKKYNECSTWGHSTPEVGAKLAIKANVKKLYILHHGPKTDDELSTWEESLRKEYPFLFFAKSGIHKNKFQKVLDVGINLTAEKDPDKLLEIIVRDAMDITGADGGTLYLLKDDTLEFKIMITKSMNYFRGGKGDPIDLPPLKLTKSAVASAAVIENKTINIPDAYNCDLYDFSGPKNYDKMTGYKTTSVMVVPMWDEHGEIIGVIQLINASDEMGEVISFSKEDEKIIEALASQTAISLSNQKHTKMIDDLLFGFVGVMSKGIDMRTPYNANHTKSMVSYADKFIDYQRDINGPYALEFKDKRELLMSVWLHDIGKLITPLEIMDKQTRLGSHEASLKNRFKEMKILNRLAFSEGRITEDEYKAKLQENDEDLEFIMQINTAGFLPDEKLERVEQIAQKTYEDLDGTVQPVITEEEKHNLSIRKGTLTNEERKIMEGHVEMTKKMLSELDFPKDYDQVPFYAGSHHEFLNGKGYPLGLTAEQLPWQVRFLSMVDIYDALTAQDRPYKPPMPTEKAFAVLNDMVSAGQLDGDIVQAFIDSKAWER